MEPQWPLILFTTLVAWSAGLFASQGALALKGGGRAAQLPALACSAALLAAGPSPGPSRGGAPPGPAPPGGAALASPDPLQRGEHGPVRGRTGFRCSRCQAPFVDRRAESILSFGSARAVVAVVWIVPSAPVEGRGRADASPARGFPRR